MYYIHYIIYIYYQAMNPGLTLPNCLTSSGDPWAFTSCAGASGSSWGRRKQQWGETHMYIIYIYIYLVEFLVEKKWCFSGNFMGYILYIYIYVYIPGWWFQPTPLKNDGVKVSWDDDIPTIWKNNNCLRPPNSSGCLP